MELQKLQYTVEDGVGIIAMNYPQNLNAIDEQMADELLYVVDACENDPEVKVVVMKGMPKAFSAGGDIGYFYDICKSCCSGYSIWFSCCCNYSASHWSYKNGQT